MARMKKKISERDAISKLQFVLQWDENSRRIIYKQRLLDSFVIRRPPLRSPEVATGSSGILENPKRNVSIECS